MIKRCKKSLPFGHSCVHKSDRDERPYPFAQPRTHAMPQGHIFPQPFIFISTPFHFEPSLTPLKYATFTFLFIHSYIDLFISDNKNWTLKNIKPLAHKMVEQHETNKKKCIRHCNVDHMCNLPQLTC